ncbi:MAG: AAA family ATPase [Micrococcales bacterium]|nr:AAA family ATPase [Micrococcales bacterium]
MLGVGDPLPLRPRRVLVAGVTGSGKSTFAAELGGVLDLPYTEIDGLYHGPHWTPRPQFSDEVQALVADDAWVTEWQYRAARETLLDRAELLVWLDFPFPLTLRRLLQRTVRRRIRREVLWHGNVEPPLRSFFTAPDDNIVRWAISTRHKYRALIPDVAERRPDLAIVRLGSPAETRRWIGGIVRGELLAR